MAQRARYGSTMAPLQVEPIFYNGLPTPEGSMKSHSDLADSPVEEEDTLSRSDGLSQEGDRFVPIKKPAKQSPSNKKPKSSDKQSNSAFRFVVVDHPNQLRDRQEMRENRMHVMHDYLNKERKRPESRDTRVNGSARSNRKQKDLGLPSTKSGTSLALPVNNFRVDVSRLTPPDSVGSDCSSDREAGERSAKRPAPASRSKAANSGEPAALIRRVYNPPLDDQRLVSGIGGRWQYSDYMKMTPNDIPASPGSRVDPFYQLPPLIDPTLDVNALKWSCSQRFGSDKLAQNWIPALLRARHAFLSTLCISSSHDAIMSRALAPANAQNPAKNIQRWKVKRDVISLLTEAMKDPELQVADETMVSVVHLLVSDIMGCDDRDLKIHQDGLINMATARGGLDKLGVGGELAAIMTIMNYLVAVVREIQPHRDYVKFATTISDASPKPSGSKPLPESPVYCGPNGFHTIHRVVRPGSDIDELLSTVRALTNEFYIENGRNSPIPSDASRFRESSHESVASLCQKVFAFQPARDKEFNDMNERYTYESIRLTSLVYAHALANRIPISKAAEELSKQNHSSATASPGRKNSDPSHNADKSPSMAIQIKYALVRTDISFCWDHMGGVLFWVALIGGAAANPGPFAEQERWGEEEDARKFLAAIAVRCCVVLSFQFGTAILETLRRVNMIETALQQGSWHEVEEVSVSVPSLTTESSIDSVWSVPGSVQGAFGPTPPSESMQKGFADFVQDFMSSGQL